MPDLAFRDQLLHRARDILDRHLRIDSVLIEQIDELRPQSLERSLGDALDVLGPAVEAVPRAAIGIETELGGDHDPVANRASASPTSSSLVNGP